MAFTMKVLAAFLLIVTSSTPAQARPSVLGLCNGLVCSTLGEYSKGQTFHGYIHIEMRLTTDAKSTDPADPRYDAVITIFDAADQIAFQKAMPKGAFGNDLDKQDDSQWHFNGATYNGSSEYWALSFLGSGGAGDLEHQQGNSTVGRANFMLALDGNDAAGYRTLHPHPCSS